MLSGKEALIALANGKRVEYSCDNYKDWKSADIADLQIRDFGSGHFEFRLKPQTVKIMVEVPKPFEPKHGDRAWVLSNTDERGYNFCDGNYDIHCMYGAWRTEEEIKQVVAELRKLKCTT